MAQLVKHLPAMRETWLRFLGGKTTGERIGYPLQYSWASLVAPAGKESACKGEYLCLIPGFGKSPGAGTATHSSILAWRIPWTVYSPWGRKESDTAESLSLIEECNKIVNFIVWILSVELKEYPMKRAKCRVYVKYDSIVMKRNKKHVEKCRKMYLRLTLLGME